MLSEALQQAAEVAGEFSPRTLPEPVPLQSNVPHAEPTYLRPVDAASSPSVTVDDGSEPLTFEEAFAAEQALDTDLEPGPEQPSLDDTAETPVTPEQRIAELEAQIIERDKQQIISRTESAIAGKWQEGHTHYAQKIQNVRVYGAQQGFADADIERAVGRVLAEQAQWVNRYHYWREGELNTAWDIADGVDAISTVISDFKLTDSDRSYLTKFTDPQSMELAAEMLSLERAKLATRDQGIRQAARRKVARTMTQDQFTPQSSGGPASRPVRVQGSDAELDFMIANRPSRRRRSA